MASFSLQQYTCVSVSASVPVPVYVHKRRERIKWTVNPEYKPRMAGATLLRQVRTAGGRLSELCCNRAALGLKSSLFARREDLVRTQSQQAMGGEEGPVFVKPRKLIEEEGGGSTTRGL